MNHTEILKPIAIRKGLCAEWQGMWGRDSSVDEMLSMYIRGIDFCIKNNFPDNRYMKENAPGPVLARHGIYIDRHLTDNITIMPTLVLSGSCTGKITVPHIHVVTIYVRNNCDVEIETTGRSRVFVKVYDNANVRIVSRQFSKSFAYVYGGHVISDTATIRNRMT